MLLGWLLGSWCNPEQDNELVCTQNGLALGSAVLCTGLRRTLSFSSAYEQARNTESLNRVPVGWIVHKWDREEIPGIVIWCLTVNHLQNGIFSWGTLVCAFCPSTEKAETGGLL